MLTIATCMAQNADDTCRAISAYIGHRLGTATRFIEGISWQEREALLDAGQVQLCWICGLPYIWKADAGEPALELCAAPVMQHARYQDSPIYFSDIVVHRHSKFHNFADLRGASWAYNEPRSHSGYNVVAHHLSTLEENAGYFSAVVESGAHQASLHMIVEGRVQASAIDSTVLEAELRSDPEIASKIRVIGALGPSPMPPWVMARSVAPELRAAVMNALLDMQHDAQGQSILGSWGIARFAAVDDAAYTPIRRMAHAAQAVRL